jgi:hypothetical protein
MLDNMQIKNVEKTIRSLFGIQSDHGVNFHWAGKRLDIERKWFNYQIPDGSTIHLVLRAPVRPDAHINFVRNSSPQPKTLWVRGEIFERICRIVARVASENWPSDRNFPGPKVVADELLMMLLAKASAGEKDDITATMECSPPPRLDVVWHALLLETKLYVEFCDKVTGIFLHHTAETAADNVAEKQRRVDLTLAIRCGIFPTIPANAWCWESEQSINSRIPEHLIPQGPPVDDSIAGRLKNRKNRKRGRPDPDPEPAGERGCNPFRVI